MLSNLPDELLSTLGLTCGRVDASLLTRLSETCQRFYTILNRNDNPALYAALFRDQFDVAALERRFGGPAAASALALEYTKRIEVMTRLRRQVTRGQLHWHEGGKEQMSADLWLVYLMVIEHDKLNLFTLRRHAHIETFVNLYLRDFLSPADPGYPVESVDRSLAINLQFLLMTKETFEEETKEESEIRFLILKPFVVAAHKYSATYAPWSMSRLPPAASPSSAAAYILALEQCHTSASAPTQVQHFGRTLSLVPPPASHAAIRSFFIRTQTEPQRAGLFGFTPTGGFGPLRDTTSTKAPMPTLQSELYDLDFQRLLRCHNPRSSLGLPKQTFSGLVAGAWEGRFSFFDFDSYREMLAGRMRSLYEGPFGDQPQVWRISEKNVSLPSSLFGRYALQDAQGIDALFAATSSLPTLNEVETVRAAEDGSLETLITGESHSAWGKARLTGRVRQWDGLVVLMKEYVPAGGRGRWLYRGYVTQGNVMVGRWRDTFTPSTQIGYEGCFTMVRRGPREQEL